MFLEQGFQVVANVLSAQECKAIESELQCLSMLGAGTRNLLDLDWCVALAAKLRLSPGIAPLLPASHVAVQCTYFEKSLERNWLVALHQDLLVPVAERIDHPSLSVWSEKEGVNYVRPPLSVLESLLAIRVHVDPCGIEDGPLRVLPGSHALGIIAGETVSSVREEWSEVSCVVAQGGAVVLRPLILHASSKATGRSHRRVLHFLFGCRELPYGLRWQVAV